MRGLLKFSKRGFLLGVLVLFLVVGVFSFTHKAHAFVSGSGTQGDPYIIGSCSDWEAIGNQIGTYFSLSADLDCTGDGNGVIVPYFYGNLNGNGHTITVSINANATDLGLFFYIFGGTVNNLKIAGSVTGTASNGIVGGFAGHIKNYSSTNSLIEYVQSSVNVSSSGNNTGGLFGTMDNGTVIKDSFTTGTVWSSGNNVGGLVGQEIDGTISDSYATGSVSGGTNIGGLVGYMGDGTVSIINSFSTGAIAGSAGEGGLVGTISNNGGTITNDYFDATTSGMGITCISNNPGDCSAVNQGGASPTYFKNDNSNPPLSLWNFTGVWSAVTGGYPVLAAAPTDLAIPTVTTVNPPTAITTTTVTLAGSITNTGGEDANTVGFHYGLNNTYGSNVSSTSGPYGAAQYGEGITGLTCNTTYHYQAFATNSVGTGVGSDQTFTTSACPVAPTVTTGFVSSLTSSSVTLGGTITDTGGDNPTARYIEYGTTNTYGSQSASDTGSFGTGAFTESISGLIPNTLYHFAACATNSVSTVCGSDQTFTTPVNGDGRVKITITDISSAPVKGATVSVECDGGAFVILGTTDVNGVVEAIPGADAKCTDGNTLAVRAAKATYLTNTSSSDPYYNQYYYSGVDPELPATFNGPASNTYSLELHALDTGNTDSYFAQYWDLGHSGVPQFPDTAPTVTTTDATISQHLLDNASPLGGVGSQYVTRYTKTATFDAGNYTFNICSDDGERLYIDGAIVSDDWVIRGRTCDTPSVDITAGTHTITLEYFQQGAGQSLDFSYGSTVVPASLQNGYESNDISVTPANPGTQNDEFSKASAIDSSYWTTALSTMDGGYDSQVFKFKPSLNGFTTPRFDISWVGHGAVPDNKKVYLSVWNFITSSWDQIASKHCATDCTLSGSQDAATHKDKDGNVWLWAKADNSFLPPVISNVTDNSGLLPVQWSTDQSATSELVWDTTSHTNFADYANHVSDSDLLTTHSITPSVSDNATKSWRTVASDSTGTKLSAIVDCGDIWTSADSGATWIDQTGAPTGQCWATLSSSGDGNTLIAAYGPTNIWQGHYDGTTWTWTDISTISTNFPVYQNWMGTPTLALSSNGSILTLGIYNAGVYTATYSSGTWTWTQQGALGGGYWESVASSSDGNRIVLGQNCGDVWTGYYDGTTWTWTDQKGGSAPGSICAIAAASSSNGTKVFVSPNYGQIWAGSFDGTTWTWTQATSPSGWWYGLASSSNGMKLAAGNNCGTIITSSDGGSSWSSSNNSGSHCWNGLASSSDGTKLVASSSNADVFTSSDSGTTWSSATGTQWFYRVKSTNANGQTTISPEYSFKFASTNSCPFVFTWNGAQYKFMIDASNSGNLGVGLDRLLWDANPFYKDPNSNNNYPNPLSYTKIPGTNLVPRTVGNETFYDIKTTTELDETNYYDKAALEVVDHDPSVDVYPDYRNNGVLHTIAKNAAAPVSVIDQQGTDVTSLVATDDNTYWHSRLSAGPEDPTYLTIKLTNDTTTDPNLKLLIKGTKEGPFSGGKGSDQLQYENAQGKFVAVPASFNPFIVRRNGAPYASRNLMNTYGVQYKVIDLSGLPVKDNTIRLVTTSNIRQWDIDWLAVDTSPDAAMTVTTETPYSADLHERGISALVKSNPSDPKMAVTEPSYNQVVKKVGEGFPLTGNATKYGDVTPLLSDVDNKFVIMTQGDELALKYAVPAQTNGTQRDFIYYTWDYHKAHNNADGQTIGPLPFNEMTQYPYNTAVENYPTDADHQAYQNTYNTRVINWGTVQQNGSEIHHSLNTDYIGIKVSESATPVVTTPPSPGVVLIVPIPGTTGNNPSIGTSHLGDGNRGKTLPLDCIAGLTKSPSTGISCNGATFSGNNQSSTNNQQQDNTKPQPFLKNLKKGMDNPDVARLEHYLNTHKFPVATSGWGSLNQEATVFGAKTVKALAKFQKSIGLPANGYFGPMTRAYVNAHLD